MTSNSQTPVNSNQDTTTTDESVATLLDIAKGDLGDLHFPKKLIITGKKLKNDVLREFVRKYKEETKSTPEQVLDIILGFDELIEKGILTDEFLKQLSMNPDILKNHINKLKNK